MTHNLFTSTSALTDQEVEAQLNALRYTNAVWDRLIDMLNDIAADLNEGVTTLSEVAGAEPPAVAL